ncbi:hypothetical protein TcCL_ESM12337, partial [Trypanosoma cruzi]
MHGQLSCIAEGGGNNLAMKKRSKEKDGGMRNPQCSQFIYLLFFSSQIAVVSFYGAVRFVRVVEEVVVVGGGRHMWLVVGLPDRGSSHSLSPSQEIMGWRRGEELDGQMKTQK